MTVLRRSIDTLALVALTLIALVPVSAAFAATGFWIAAAGGTLLGAVIAVAGARWRWHPLSVAAIVVVVYFAFGGALVFRAESILGVIPNLDVIASLAVGVVQVWKQALTLQAPFIGFDQLTVIPYVAGLVVSALAVSVALRARVFWLALLPVAALLIGSIAFSTYAGLMPGAVGAVFAGIALAWVVWRQRLARSALVSAEERAEVRAEERAENGDAAARRPLGAVAAIAVLLLAGTAIGGGAATAATLADREVLRDVVVPPLQLQNYASPLTSYRKYARDGADTTFFTVTGLPAGARLRLAALDLYDGIVYKVSGGGGAGSGVFSRVGREIRNPVAGDPAHLTIRIQDLTGVWVPTVGYSSGIAFGGTDATERSAALHYNSATGTALITTGLATGDEYSLDVTVPATPSEDDVASAQVSEVRTPAPAAVPDEITSLLDKAVAGATTPVEQVRAIEAYFQTTGFYSSGLEGQVMSRSGHSLNRESALLSGTQMVGDDEQYSVAMALMVAQLGLPVRVVMGFEAPADSVGGDTAVPITGEDLHAWVEVPFDGLGWVAFTPTPAKDRVPEQETPEQSQKPQAQVAQPPQTPQEPAELPPAVPVQDAASQDTPVDLAWLWTTLRIGGIALVVLAALLGPSVALAVARARRRTRRAAASSLVQRVDGGWAELVDAAVDVGAPVAIGATRREQAAALDESFADASVATLAHRADAVVFGAGEPGEEEARQYWDDVATATRQFHAGVPWHRRLRAAFFPASIVRRIRPPWRRRRGGDV